ncbi:MAG: hypothetical protein RBS24_00025 [Bacilli bacterium]|nr:hypothetical protein [Bacilli bacterium]
MKFEDAKILISLDLSKRRYYSGSQVECPFCQKLSDHEPLGYLHSDKFGSVVCWHCENTYWLLQISNLIGPVSSYTYGGK